MRCLELQQFVKDLLPLFHLMAHLQSAGNHVFSAIPTLAFMQIKYLIFSALTCSFKDQSGQS